jgi:hypothetical protein
MVNIHVTEPEPHHMGRWIRTRIKSNSGNMDSDMDRSQDSGSLWGTGGSVSQWSQGSYHFDEEQDLDLYPHQSDKSDSDPHRSEKRDPDPHQCDANPKNRIQDGSLP